MDTQLQLLSEHVCFGGVQRFYAHASEAIGLPMRFSVFLPAHSSKRPALRYLAGLTCNEETFMTKAWAQRVAAELGLILVAPDTSSRGAGFSVDAARVGIFGHAMRGHGALTLALQHPSVFRCVSAFAPICVPMRCPWGTKAFTGYLGSVAAGARYDASPATTTAITSFPPLSKTTSGFTQHSCPSKHLNHRDKPWKTQSTFTRPSTRACHITKSPISPAAPSHARARPSR